MKRAVALLLVFGLGLPAHAQVWPPKKPAQKMHKKPAKAENVLKLNIILQRDFESPVDFEKPALEHQLVKPPKK